MPESMLHIIGLAHRAQAVKPSIDVSPEQKAFTECLDRAVKQVRPDFIGEEDSEEGLTERGEVSIAGRMATERGIEHVLCDPTHAQRRDLGYKDGMQLEIEISMSYEGWAMSHDEIHLKARATEMGRYFPIRERFWLDQLGGRAKHDGVFICGNAHIESFTELLQSRGIPFRIVERGIGVTPEEVEDWERIVEYLKAHPELKS